MPTVDAEPAATPGPPLPGTRPVHGGRLGRVGSVSAVVVLAALWGVTLAGRQLSAPPALLAGVVVFLPYLYALALLVGFAVWTAVPDRRTVPVVLGALVVTGLSLWAPGRHRQPPGAVVEPVRVMTWNVQRLWGQKDGVAMRCVVETVAERQPDVLALLEISARDLDRFAAASSLDCRHHPYTSLEGAERGGLATCVRRDGRWRVTHVEAARFVDDEDWYYLLTEMASGERRFNLLGVHLYPYRGVAQKLRRGVGSLTEGDPGALVALGGQGEAVFRGQSDQAAALIERVTHLQDPTVVAGDFNSTRDAALHVALRDHLTDAWEAAGGGFGGTVSLFGLPLRVDYVYTSRELGVVGAEVPAAGCSDHAPVVADLGFLR